MINSNQDLMILIILMYFWLIPFRFIRPQFFYKEPLVSFVQLVIGPYGDELGNVLPNAVEGVGVPVDPLAFVGLLGYPSFYLLLLLLQTY
jgi:hypothetical protein